MNLAGTVDGIDNEFHPGKIVKRDFLVVDGFGVGILLKITFQEIAFTRMQHIG